MSENEIIFPKEEIECIFCEENRLVVAFCKTCNGFLCEKCFLIHQTKKYLNHEFIINNFENKESMFYKFKNENEIESTQKIKKIKISKIKEEKIKIEENLKILNPIINENNILNNNLIDQISIFFENLKTLIEKRKEEILNELKKEFEKKIIPLNQKRNKLNEIIKEILNLIQNFQNEIENEEENQQKEKQENQKEEKENKENKEIKNENIFELISFLNKISNLILNWNNLNLNNEKIKNEELKFKFKFIENNFNEIEKQIKNTGNLINEEKEVKINLIFNKFSNQNNISIQKNGKLIKKINDGWDNFAISNQELKNKISIWKIKIINNPGYIFTGIINNLNPNNPYYNDKTFFGWQISVYIEGENKGYLGGWETWKTGEEGIFKLDKIKQKLILFIPQRNKFFEISNLPNFENWYISVIFCGDGDEIELIEPSNEEIENFKLLIF